MGNHGFKKIFGVRNKWARAALGLGIGSGFGLAMEPTVAAGATIGSFMNGGNRNSGGSHGGLGDNAASVDAPDDSAARSAFADFDGETVGGDAPAVSGDVIGSSTTGVKKGTLIGQRGFGLTSNTPSTGTLGA